MSQAPRPMTIKAKPRSDQYPRLRNSEGERRAYWAEVTRQRRKQLERLEMLREYGKQIGIL